MYVFILQNSIKGNKRFLNFRNNLNFTWKILRSVYCWGKIEDIEVPNTRRYITILKGSYFCRSTFGYILLARLNLKLKRAKFREIYYNFWTLKSIKIKTLRGKWDIKSFLNTANFNAWFYSHVTYFPCPKK